MNDPLRLGGAPFAALFTVLMTIASMPVLLCESLPLFDYPNHLARMHVLLQPPGSISSYYEVVWRALPNLAMDLAVPPLARWLPLAWAGKVFIVATLCLLAGGTALLHRVLFSSWSAWPLLASLLLYSRILLWGFLNFLFGVGASLIALALWIGLDGRPRLRLAAGTVSALVLFFAHLLAFGLYGVMVFAYELGVILRERPPIVHALSALMLAGAPFLPTFGIFLLLTPGVGSGDIVFNHILRKIDLPFSVFDNYHQPFDIACFLLATFALGFAFWRRWIRLHPAIAMPLGLLFLTYLIMPTHLATAARADVRIPLLVGLALIAGSRWTAPKVSAAHAFIGAAFFLFLFRLGVVASEWRQSDRFYAPLLAALDKIQSGSRVAVANPRGEKWAAIPLLHFPAWAVVRRDAFVPTLFASPAQQPIALRPHYLALASQLTPDRLWDALKEGRTPLDATERAALAEFDFVVFVGPQPFAVPQTSGLSPIVTTPRFVLARVEPLSWPGPSGTSGAISRAAQKSTGLARVILPVSRSIANFSKPSRLAWPAGQK